MKKETIVAIVLGVVLGLGVAVAISMKTHKKEIQKIKPIASGLPVTPTIIIEQQHSESLEVSEPQTGDIVQEKSITIKGKAPKDGLVIIQSPVSSEAFKNENSSFTMKFPLAAGENVILVSFYPKGQSGNPIEKELKIFSLTEQ